MPPRSPRQRGFALIWVSVALVVLAGVVFAGLERMTTEHAAGATRFAVDAQAHEVARAGLVDAIAWLRRQPGQPVVDFTPGAEGEAADTEAPEVGLVRTFEISPGLWARYEVRRGRGMDPFTDLNDNGVWDEGEPFVDLDDGTTTPDAISDGYGDSAWTPSLWTRDVGAERGVAGTGAVWRVESRGMILRRSDPNLPLGEGPNRILAQTTLATEVRRMILSPPGAAGLCVRREGDLTLGARARLRSGALAIAVGSDWGKLEESAYSEIDAPTKLAVLPEYDDSLLAVFGVDWGGLKSMADESVVQAGEVVGRALDDELVVVEGNAVFGPDAPLEGRGILAVRGDLAFQAGSNTSFSGLLYVEGNLTLYGPASVYGTIIATGAVHVEGGVGDYADVVYDAGILSTLLDEIGQYRVTRAIYVPLHGLFEATP